MATVAQGSAQTIREYPQDRPLERALDRWIYVFMALWFIAIVLAGFIPDSLMKIEAVRAGERPPFPIVLHMHAVVMGSFLLLLLTQATLAATGRVDLHRRVGPSGMVLGPALVIVGLVLVPTMYHAGWNAAQAAPAELRDQAMFGISVRDDIALLQLRIGILFPILLAIGLRARRTDPGLHKRMMFLAVALALPAGFDRIPWLWTTMPVSPVSPDLLTLVGIAPMFLWDVARTRTVHRAYWIGLALFVPAAIVVHSLWDTPWWHQMAPRIMGVG